MGRNYTEAEDGELQPTPPSRASENLALNGDLGGSAEAMVVASVSLYFASGPRWIGSWGVGLCLHLGGAALVCLRGSRLEPSTELARGWSRQSQCSGTIQLQYWIY